MKIADGTPYQPSSGTAGEGFMEHWCYRCKCDKAYQDSGGNEPGCDIIARSMAFKPGDKEYPVEWIWKSNEPVCTAFDDVTLGITNEERAAQLPLPI